MEKTYPFTLNKACRWCRKKNVPKSPRQLFLRLSKCSKKTNAMLVGFLNKQLKQLQDEAECEEYNTL